MLLFLVLSFNLAIFSKFFPLDLEQQLLRDVLFDPMLSLLCIDLDKSLVVILLVIRVIVVTNVFRVLTPVYFQFGRRKLVLSFLKPISLLS